MTWNDFLRKIGSRKFWALLAVFIPALLVFTGVIYFRRCLCGVYVCRIRSRRGKNNEGGCRR